MKGLLHNLLWVLGACLAILFKGVLCVYFTQTENLFCAEFRLGVVVGQIQAQPNSSDKCNVTAIQYRLQTGDDSGPHSVDFAINSTGWIYIEKISSAGNINSDVFHLNVQAGCKLDNDFKVASVTVNDISQCYCGNEAYNSDVIHDDVMSKFCFQREEFNFYIEENISPLKLGNLGVCSVGNYGNNVKRIYNIQASPAYGVYISQLIRYGRACSNYEDFIARGQLLTTRLQHQGYTTPRLKSTFRKFFGRQHDIVGLYEKSASDTRSDIARKFSIDSESSSFKLIQYFDREEYDFIGFKVNCTISKDNKVIWSKTANIKLSIGDVNDNPILIMRNLHSFINRVDKDLGPGENVSTFVLIDKDLYNCSSHRVTHLTDPHRVCRDATISQFNYWGKYDNKHVICKLAVTVSREQIMDGNFYMCKLGIKDPEYKPFGNTNFTDTTIIRINISNVKPPTITPPTFHIASLHRGAAKFTRILSLSSLGFKAYFMTKPKAFQITRETGILYVDDPTMLKGKEQNVSVVAVKNNQGPGSNMETIVVRVNLLSPERDSNRTCENSCSMASTMDGCKSGCGYGVETGHCIWRSSADVTTATWSKAYQTCTYNPHLCPNGICDELERAEPNLCPQDCTETVVGPGILNSNVFPPRGIIMAAGPCWCSYNARCTCFDSTSTIRTTHRPDLRLNKTNEQQRQIDEGDEGYSEMTLNVTTGQLHSNHLSQAGDAGPCDENCKTTIAATVGCLGAAVCLFILGWRLRKLRCHNGQNLKKYVGSLVSVSAVPSDYHDDREMYRNTFVDPQWNIKGPMAYSPTPEDTKWEFERDNLILDQTLGEGEFGRVVKAKFYQMDSKDGYKEVAVKMLKNCASTAELHDLLSEFNLLKDVNHPNVIKLLGACTQNGPFYVIVEYCEHGSLLHYLRRSRLEENGYVNNRFRHRELYNGEHLEPELLTVGDLLSFAWQIGKGMKYLSEIKLVHRDLAARNVLVATGKILKISDFGLTRDVYEADTYLKQSKGRIPVKWLAPESLYAQIYTTLSDVWSYGIVLWEIVTLGAPPYPGIPPERLYNLLIAGYRMDRPESCTDELYAVMQKCWKSDPSERPTFSQLTEIFDRLLQQRTEYLDLTGGAIEQRPDMYDRCFEKSSTDKFFDNLTAEPEEQRTPTDKYGSISVISGNMESYLTPSSVDRTEPDDRVFFGNKVMFDNTEERDVNKLSFKKCLEPKDTIRMDENLSLLPDTGTALFSPSMSEVDEDWDPHETDVLSVQVH